MELMVQSLIDVATMNWTLAAVQNVAVSPIMKPGATSSTPEQGLTLVSLGVKLMMFQLGTLMEQKNSKCITRLGKAVSVL